MTIDSIFQLCKPKFPAPPSLHPTIIWYYLKMLSWFGYNIVRLSWSIKMRQDNNPILKYGNLKNIVASGLFAFYFFFSLSVFLTTCVCNTSYLLAFVLLVSLLLTCVYATYSCLCDLLHPFVLLICVFWGLLRYRVGGYSPWIPHKDLSAMRERNKPGSWEPAVTPLKWSRLSLRVVCKIIIPTERNDTNRKRKKHSREEGKHTN